MAEKDEKDKPADRESEYMKGGKGRRDEVGGSGIYPASAPNVPADAEVRTEGDLVTHKGSHPKSDESSGSE